MTRAERLRARLLDALAAEHVDVEDDSARHAGHPGATGGASHFVVVVVSSRFDAMSRLDRHRAVYAATGDMIPDEIHALSARAYTPAEWRALNRPAGSDRSP